MRKLYKVPATILEQLGGNKFQVMTGAKVASFDAFSLILLLKGNPKRIRYVYVILDLDDTYIVDFSKMIRGEIKTTARLTGIYAENLREVFTEHTGLLTSL